MKAFVRFVANSQNLALSSFLRLGGFIIIVFLSLPNFAFSINSNIDTIGIVASEEIPFSDCLSAGMLQGNFESIEIWFEPINGTGDLELVANTPCYTFTPNPGETGNFIDTLGLIICDDLGICDSTAIVISVEPNDCPNIITDESVDISVFECFEFGTYCLPIEPAQLFNYIITDNGQPYFQGFVPCDLDSLLVYPTDVILLDGASGPFRLLNWVENGNVQMIDSFDDLETLVDSMNIWDPTGNWTFTSEGKIEGGTEFDVYGALEITQLVSPFNTYTINLSSLEIPNGSQIAVDTGYHEIIVNNFFTGCRDTIILNVDCTNIFCPDLYSGMDTLNAISCDSLTTVCLDLPLINLPNYTISDNGETYIGATEVCRFDSMVTYLTIGYNEEDVYALESWFFNGTNYSIDTFMTVEQLVDSMRIWDSSANWQLDGLVISGFNFSNSYGDLIVSQNGLVIATSNLNVQVEPVGISIEVDSGYHELILIDTLNGCTDTVGVFIDCVPFMGSSFDSTLVISQGMLDTFCFDVSGLGSVSSIVNVCPESSNGNVSFEIIPGQAPCVEYGGIQLGVDTFCVQICDANIGFCDTTNLIIMVEPEPDTFYSSLQLSFMDTICIDTSIFAGTINQFNNFCFQENVSIALDEENYCVEFMATNLGLDTICIQMCDDQGFCNTSYIFVETHPQTIDTFELEVAVEMLDTICMNTEELFGEIVSIENYCLSASGAFVDFDVLDDNCVSLEGLLPEGTDTACIEICTALGFCDTTILLVTTGENTNLDPPVAIDDEASTLTNMPVIIPVLNNDTLNSTVVDIDFVNAPDNGMLVMNPDFSFTYIPNPGYCGGIDNFSYLVITLGGTASASVSIEVRCDELVIFNGMSPNGDGVNDGFKINGLDNYVSNSVRIFNRWGNEVFVKTNYDNDDPFMGEWEGEILPDGTYFYFIEVVEADGSVLKYNGSLTMHR